MIKVNEYDMMTIEEVADYTGYKISYLYKLCCQRKIRRFNRNGGRKSFFLKSDIIAMMQGCLIKTEEEILREEEPKYTEVVRKPIKKYVRAGKDA